MKIKRKLKRIEKRVEHLERLLDQKQVHGEARDVFAHLKDRPHCIDKADK
ncbi:MAG: hypothetical protein PHE53_07670 [Thermoguttaceae bacterium]|nr:hypothetical protein [Thermoguttaceae bacterium]